MKKYIEQIVESLDDEVCRYCIYGIDCPGPVTSYGNGPVFAPCHDGNPENWFDIDLYIEGESEMFKIEKIIYNNPATIVWFADGEKVVVKAYNEEFDKEKGVAMAIARKLYSRSEFIKLVESGETQQKLEKIFEKTAKQDFEMNREEYAICPNCRESHKVEYGEEILKDGTRVPSELLAFVKCIKNEEAYLVGVAGKRI